MSLRDRAVAILADLVAIPTVPGEQNEAWLVYVENLLGDVGARITRVPSSDRSCTGLVASIGPDLADGIVLSGHVDVVDVAGQDWQRDPFRLSEEGELIFGRGTTDMKGFVACALAVLETLKDRDLEHPVHLALSADEETGCTNAGTLAAYVADKLPSVKGVLVGEPSMMKPVNQHKGSYSLLVEVIGRSAHASQPELGLSATALAAHLMTWIDEQSARSSAPDATTHTVGLISGGTANNIVAENCRFDWDIRLPSSRSLDEVVDAAAREASRLLKPHLARVPEAAISISRGAAFPGFFSDPSDEFAQLCLSISGANHCSTVTYGSEAGVFHANGLRTMIMGPGDIAQAHIPDEYVERSQLEKCLDILLRLVA